GDHNDFLMVFAIVLGFYLLLRARGADATVPANGPVAAPGADTSSGSRGALGRIGGWLWPLSAPEIGAGAAFVAAAALKASGGVLIPIVLAGLIRAPRRLIQVLLGMVLAGAVIGGASLVAFG